MQCWKGREQEINFRIIAPSSFKHKAVHCYFLLMYSNERMPQLRGVSGITGWHCLPTGRKPWAKVGLSPDSSKLEARGGLDFPQLQILPSAKSRKKKMTESSNLATQLHKEVTCIVFTEAQRQCPGGHFPRNIYIALASAHYKNP